MAKSGRSISKNIDYFPHKCKDDKELTFIRHKYKSEGYEVYYRIQQSLGDADYHFIDLKDDLQKSMFYMVMQVKPEIADGVVDILVAMDWLDKDLYEKHKILWSDTFMDSIRAVYINRIRKDPNRHIPTKQDIYRYSTCRNKSIVEDSIVEDSIEKESKEKKSKNDDHLSFSEYEKLYPNKDLTKLKKYLSFDNPTHNGALKWCERELKTKKLIFDKTRTGLYKAWCSKCGKKEFPKDDWQLEKGSECCRVKYLNNKKRK